MLFSAPPFFLFFGIYFLCHLVVPGRLRIWLIIIGSTVFYGYWNPFYVLLPHVLMLIAFGGVLWMDGAAGEASRRRRLIAVVVALLAPLAFVKYTNFVFESFVQPFLPFDVELVQLPLPLGISFVTFTLIAYAVDVFKGKFPVVRTMRKVAGFVLFFPHLIAGPILRPHELIPQFDKPRRPLSAPMVLGMAIFAVGLAKKLVFADQLAPFVDAVYNDPMGHAAEDYLLAIYGFSLQIYCDFSGYTTMAIGCAVLINIRLPDNFMRPYGADSIVDFWRRWHITLSLWLRDYLYIPLGGSRKGWGRQLRNVMITMLLGGLWHGASWTFVIWGGIHGLGIVACHVIRRLGWSPALARIPRWLWVVVTFHFVTLAWIFFRAQNLTDALVVLQGPFVAGFGDLSEFAAGHRLALLLLGLFLLLHRWDDHRQIRLFVRRMPRAVTLTFIAFLVVLSMVISAGSSQEFIYFDF